MSIIILVIFIFILCLFALGGALDRHHESCRPETDTREFIDPLYEPYAPIGSSPAPAGLAPSAQDSPKALECGMRLPLSSAFDCIGRVEILCARCQTASTRLRALPNGNVVCPACHEKLILDAVFTPLE